MTRAAEADPTGEIPQLPKRVGIEIQPAQLRELILAGGPLRNEYDLAERAAAALEAAYTVARAACAPHPAPRVADWAIEILRDRAGRIADINIVEQG